MTLAESEWSEAQSARGTIQPMQLAGTRDLRLAKAAGIKKVEN
jgi:hypothetical protein